MSTLQGEVEWCRDGLHGWVRLDDGRRVFIHRTVLGEGEVLGIGDRVEVDVEMNGDRLDARRVRRCDPRSYLKTDIEIADQIALALTERPVWSEAQLAERGIPRALRAVRREAVLTRLGQWGLRALREHGRIVRQRLPALGARAVVEDDGDGAYSPPEEALLERALGRLRCIYVVGPPGAGKTSMVLRTLRRRFGERVLDLSLHGETTWDDLIGCRELSASSTVFRPGPLLRALTDRIPIVLNELDVVPSEVLLGLNGVMDALLDRREIVFPFADSVGKLVRIAPEAADGSDGRTIIVATANTRGGHGEGGGAYVGAKPIHAATRDRFEIMIDLPYPGVGAETTLLVRRTGVSEEIARRVATVAHHSRAGFASGAIGIPISLRGTITLTTLIVSLGFTPEQAFKHAVLDRASEEADRAALREMWQRVWGSGK